jgi:hypothetical protein
LSLFTRFGRPPTQDETTARGDLATGDRPGRMPDGTADAAVTDADIDVPHAGGDADGAAAGAGRGRRHPVAARVGTALAALLVLGALLAPDDISHLSPGAFLRIPVEGLVAAALLLVLPARLRRLVAAAAGVLLGLLAVVKIVDIGFYEVLDRRFDLVLDWGLFSGALGVLRDSIGRAGAIGALAGAGLLVAALIIFMTLSMLRLTRLVGPHHTAAVRTVAALTTVWVACAAFGAQVVPGVPVADRSTAALVYEHARQVPAGLRDKQGFAAEAAVDPFRNTPNNKLLTGLRGKDVIISFVESYGRSAVQDPRYATQVGAVLDAGTRQLKAAGYGSRSAFLTSSTAGGGSWLAHASLLSGLWINNQQRYSGLVSSDRLTLPSAFQRAGWRTVSIESAVTGAWPERQFYGYDQGYANGDLGYRGPRFSYAPMPDQYILSTFQRTERAKPNRGPLMAEITLVSSHTPWTPTPHLVDWKDVGDGTVFRPMAEGDPPSVVWRSPTRVRTAYRESIEYSLGTLISYVQKYGDDHLVLIFLGDHQPAPIITGAGASRDVPITVIARDPAVLKRVSSWGWQDGLRPDPRAPVWRMDAFRNRFLTAFAQ